MKKKDRQTLEVNVTIEVYRDLPKLRVWGHVYKFVDNTFKPTQLKYEGDYCNTLKVIYKTVFQIEKYKNEYQEFMLDCPIKKGTYYLRNINESMVDATLFPLWKARLDYAFITEKIRVFDASAYVQVIEL
ncbi:uncharacterized protein LOC126879849 isoform X2 [Diabrotica virgifera virgifera]|nr:uncharacterized protein LOC126879849 isoform X2 [Diabrotica virgifera virgifera]